MAFHDHMNPLVGSSKICGQYHPVITTQGIQALTPDQVCVHRAYKAKRTKEVDPRQEPTEVRVAQEAAARSGFDHAIIL